MAFANSKGFTRQPTYSLNLSFLLAAIVCVCLGQCCRVIGKSNKDVIICISPWTLSQIWACAQQKWLNDVRPAKTRISLGVCPVQSESVLCALWAAKDPRLLHADSEDWSDRQMSRLICVFARCTCRFVGFIVHRLILNLNQFVFPQTRLKYWQECNATLQFNILCSDAFYKGYVTVCF